MIYYAFIEDNKIKSFSDIPKDGYIPMEKELWEYLLAEDKFIFSNNVQLYPLNLNDEEFIFTIEHKDFFEQEIKDYELPEEPKNELEIKIEKLEERLKLLEENFKLLSEKQLDV